MKRLLIVIGLMSMGLITLFLLNQPHRLSATDLPRRSVDVVNGEQVFHAGGCASCHSSGDEDQEVPLLGGGLELDTEFGVFRAPNISPHPSGGIGNWTMIGFINSMRQGISPDGRHYYPAFPYTSYSRMSIEDLMDLKAYLDTLPMVPDRSLHHSLSFPWNIRAGIGLWKLLNLDPANIVSVPDDDEQLKRGRYLVEGPGHCGECHTARNRTGGLQKHRWLAGAPNPDGEGHIPNITPHKDGLAAWSISDIEYYLASGFTPDFDTVGGSMVKVQENMARLSADDRSAVAAYLKFLPPLEKPGKW